MRRTNSKINNGARREMILRALAGESPGKLAEEYGVARSWVYSALARAREHPAEDLAEAEAEVDYWRRVSELARS